MPPITAPISVAVTSEAPCAWLSERSAEISLSMKPKDQKIEPVHRIAERGPDKGLDGIAVDSGWS